MSVEIFPADPRTIPLDMLRRYLEAKQWHSVAPKRDESGLASTPATRTILENRGSGTRNYEIYVSSDSDLQGIELIVPRSRSAGEYERQVSRVIATLSTLDDKPQSEIAVAIRSVGFDVVRSRIPDLLVTDDSIHLSIARNFVSGIRGVLTATATTELHPSPFFLRVRKEATDYADRCRFGHTFRGSFGFTIESPLEPNNQPGLPGLSPSAPFERRVIRRLARGLSAVTEAAEVDSTAPIVQTAKEGFSANICEQLASLMEETSDAMLTFEIASVPSGSWEIHFRTTEPS